MKEYLATLIRAAATPAQGRNVLREYLQARILAVLQRGGAMHCSRPAGPAQH
jgi:hypothetical protein